MIEWLILEGEYDKKQPEETFSRVSDKDHMFIKLLENEQMIYISVGCASGVI